ncbi:hypothetical protein, partial [Streptococcus agalactiae]|uniref:hypothetical protein n=1 Tax=Streptococcus agalactiae TaxID=1311 RepID=UPI0025575B36
MTRERSLRQTRSSNVGFSKGAFCLRKGLFFVVMTPVSEILRSALQRTSPRLWNTEMGRIVDNRTKDQLAPAPPIA